MQSSLRSIRLLSVSAFAALFTLLVARTSAATDDARLASPLPAVLINTDGSAVKSRDDWLTKRRPEILELFRTHVYGRAPIERPPHLSFEVVKEIPSAFDGKAVGKIVKIPYTGPGGEGHISVRLYYPKDKTPTGCLLLIVNRARRIIDDAETAPMDFWPAEAIVARGYAAAAFHYSDVAVDRAEECFKSGAFAVYGPTPRLEDSWGALGAWAWGASRVIDFLVTERALTGKPIAVAGHSRGGKAALWCGAQDQRVALAISNDSGAGGAALARRTRGELVEASTRIFPYWYAGNYRQFANNESALPVDQHMLLALMAPRLVYVASASEDAWADPAAEFGSCVEAAPVFRLFGANGVGSAVMPGIDAPRHEGSIGHHVRAGKHDLTRHDWTQFMNFADRHWAPRAATTR